MERLYKEVSVSGGVAGVSPARGVAAYVRYVDVSDIAAQGGYVPPRKNK